MKVTLELPDDPLIPLAQTGEDLPERLRLELACALYAQGHLFIAQAAKLAGLHAFAIGHALTQRGISRQIGEEEMEQDAAYVSARLHGQ